MDLTQIREEINQVDDQLVKLFVQRMELASQVAAYKREHNMPIFVPAREREILKKVAEQAGPEFGSYTRLLYATIMDLSRSHQGKQNGTVTTLAQKITQAIETTPQLFPQQAMVACQGVEGAYSQIACEKIFQNPFIMYFKNFEGVFNAIDQGLCR